jgi:hypothetical protein
MESRNPILRNSETFNGRAVRAYGHQEYPASGAGYPGYAQPAGQPQGAPAGSDPSTWQYPTAESIQEPMTIDSVVSRTALTLFVVVFTATLTWIFLPDSTIPGEANLVTPAWIGGALVGAGLGMVLLRKGRDRILAHAGLHRLRAGGLLRARAVALVDTFLDSALPGDGFLRAGTSVGHGETP